jgi:hypothetical protein
MNVGNDVGFTFEGIKIGEPLAHSLPALLFDSSGSS